MVWRQRKFYIDCLEVIAALESISMYFVYDLVYILLYFPDKNG